MTQTVDLYATVIELLGLQPPTVEPIHSQSFAPLLLGRKDTYRDSALYGYFNQRIGLTSGEWTLLRYHDPDAAPPLIFTQQVEQTGGNGFILRNRRRLEFEDLEPGRFIPGVETPVWRRQLTYDTVRHYGGTRDDLLFHNPSDPDQTHNLAAERPDMVEAMVAKLRAHAQAVQAPEEQFERLHI